MVAVVRIGQQSEGEGGSECTHIVSHADRLISGSVSAMIKRVNLVEGEGKGKLLIYRNVQRFRGGLVFKTHRL